MWCCCGYSVLLFEAGEGKWGALPLVGVSGVESSWEVKLGSQVGKSSWEPLEGKFESQVMYTNMYTYKPPEGKCESLVMYTFFTILLPPPSVQQPLFFLPISLPTLFQELILTIISW